MSALIGRGIRDTVLDGVISIDTTNDRVGINTSSPTTTLDVNGDTNVTGDLTVVGTGRVIIDSTTNSLLFLDRGTGTNESLIKLRTDGVDDWLIGMDNNPSGNDDDFAIKTTDNATGEFVIKASGGVEITTTTGALLLPRMTTTQRDALTPANGMLIYNTTDSKLQGYEASGWANLV